MGYVEDALSASSGLVSEPCGWISESPYKMIDELNSMLAELK